MKTIHEIINVSTNCRCEMLDITTKIASVVSESKIANGLVTVFTPHTTAAITINENADPDVTHDMIMTLEEMLPKNRPGYKHDEGNSDAHMKSSFFGCSETVILNCGKMQLGTWQGIYFCEFDGPRSRKVNVQIIGE
ncbi:MAG: secondary thiamine-phosphate synthase enzyme YjbQ [Anaerohalosphaeraceae bacterium]|nr:secondary thiamine-phosphate synthase enzyme YjbQ [Anaerohalosphaeraceae bacterium]